jgi:hypothetical protein
MLNRLLLMLHLHLLAMITNHHGSCDYKERGEGNFPSFFYAL